MKYTVLWDIWCSSEECKNTPFGRGLTSEARAQVVYDWNGMVLERFSNTVVAPGVKKSRQGRQKKPRRKAGPPPGESPPSGTPLCPSCKTPPRVLEMARSHWGKGGGVNVYCANENCYDTFSSSGVWGAFKEIALRKWAKAVDPRNKKRAREDTG